MDKLTQQEIYENSLEQAKARDDEKKNSLLEAAGIKDEYYEGGVFKLELFKPHQNELTRIRKEHEFLINEIEPLRNELIKRGYIK